MRIDISKDSIKSIENVLSGIKNGSKKALVTGINATVKTMNVQVKARIGKDINLKASRIAKDMKTTKANYSVIKGAVTVTGVPVGLINFAAKKTKKGVTVKVKNNKGRSLIKHAFIQHGQNSAKEHVFIRAKGTYVRVKGMGRLTWRKTSDSGGRVGRNPIERLTGPRVPDIFAGDAVWLPSSIQAGSLLASNIGKQTDLILTRLK